ncbi:MAG TPA: SDR family oxidoreductase [Acidimicrobiia bacterium]|nr:SDR family oxidoreductase [Acidimicrobiia bacterium]
MDDVLGYERRRVVVSGAATGMGAATVGILLDLGAEVTTLDVKPVTAPVKAALEIDLRDRASIDAAVAAIDGPVDALFSCAGLPGPPFSDVDVMLVNFVGARHLIESLVPQMPEGSAIATIASCAGMGWQLQLATWMELMTSDGFEAGKAWCETHLDAITGVGGAYTASKQVMNAWVCWRAAGLITQGIRLNVLNPGPTETPMMPDFERNAPGGADLINAFTKPINRRSTPEEQAWPLVMLNSPRLSYVAGHAMHADGGWFGGVQTGAVTVPEIPEG